jgi:hypothetical protein
MSGELGAGPWAAAAFAAILMGCVADSTSSSGGYATGGSGSASSGSSSGGGVAQPILADIDTNGQLDLPAGGQGIGVYVTYVSGGHWTIAWTCDTAITGLSCSFAVDASVAAADGTIQNVAGITPSATDSVSEASTEQSVEAVTSTTTNTDSMTFDTTPGTILTVSVQLNAPVSFFFVQDNQVNGGYTGALTNPMMFQPSTP